MTGPKMTARVLVADKLEEGAFRDLVARGFEIIERTDLTSENLPAALPGVKVLVVRSTIVTKEAIAAADRLALIVRAGSGTNNIDVAAASARGIYVSNCPGRNSVAVAELTLGLLLAIDRRLPDNVADLRRGKWDKGSYSKAKGLKGRRLGLVGFGAIAQEVARRAQAFELEVQAYARTLSDDVAKRFGVDRSTSLDELFESSDIVSLHVPLSKETRGMIGAALLGRLKRGAVFLNTARAEVVDQVALLEVAKAGKIWVGTDVFAAEPEGKSGDFSDELGRLPNVYGSHHIGASTDQAPTRDRQGRGGPREGLPRARGGQGLGQHPPRPAGPRHLGGAAPGPGRRVGRGLGRPPQRRRQRRDDGERDLRGRFGGLRADQGRPTSPSRDHRTPGRPGARDQR
jgi:D-3-phosphoglycerate dehydrogenase